MCRQHSYISVPGITRSSTKWQVRNQSSGWMSASARIRPEAEPAAGRVEVRDAVRPASSGRRAGGPGRGGRAPRTRGAERGRAGRRAAARRPAASSYDSTAIGTSVGPVVGPHARHRPAGRAAVWTIPLPGRQLLGREEPRAAVAHRHQRLAVDGRLELEPEQVRVPLAEELDRSGCRSGSPSPGPGRPRWNVTTASSRR